MHLYMSHREEEEAQNDEEIVSLSTVMSNLLTVSNAQGSY